MEWIARIFPFSVCELPCTNPASIYLIKVNNRKTRIMCEICLKLTISKHQNEVNGVVLLSLVLILNKFHVLFWCFHCWIGKGKCQLGSQKKKFLLFYFCILYELLVPTNLLISFCGLALAKNGCNTYISKTWQLSQTLPLNK